MGQFIKFLKDWMLVIAIVTGVSSYLLYHSIPVLQPYGASVERIIKIIQPLFLFTMLFLSFCKIRPSDLKVHRWQFKAIALQGGIFAVLALMIVWALKADGAFAGWIVRNKIPLETAMLCLICPTATACAVVTNKLGGNMAQVVTYTILINLLVSILVPLIVPMIYPQGHISFVTAFLKILSKVFPLLIMPCICAWFVRYCFPRAHSFLTGKTSLAFYIWSVSLLLAILMSTRAIVHSGNSISLLFWIAAISLLSCVLQFWFGKKIGEKYGREMKITAGQAVGQKNTVFAIWMGYTFMDPIVSVAGGFYSIWHNLFNSYQLYLARNGKMK